MSPQTNHQAAYFAPYTLHGTSPGLKPDLFNGGSGLDDTSDLVTDSTANLPLKQSPEKTNMPPQIRNFTGDSEFENASSTTSDEKK